MSLDFHAHSDPSLSHQETHVPAPGSPFISAVATAGGDGLRGRRPMAESSVGELSTRTGTKTPTSLNGHGHPSILLSSHIGNGNGDSSVAASTTTPPDRSAGFLLPRPRPPSRSLATPLIPARDPLSSSNGIGTERVGRGGGTTRVAMVSPSPPSSRRRRRTDVEEEEQSRGTRLTTGGRESRGYDGAIGASREEKRGTVEEQGGGERESKRLHTETGPSSSTPTRIPRETPESQHQHRQHHLGQEAEPPRLASTNGHDDIDGDDNVSSQRESSVRRHIEPCSYPGDDQYAKVPPITAMEVQDRMSMRDRHMRSSSMARRVQPVEMEEEFTAFSPISENEPDKLLLQRLNQMHEFWQIRDSDPPDGLLSERARQFFGVDSLNDIIPPEIEQIWLSRLQQHEILDQELVRRDLAITLDSLEGRPQQVECRRQLDVIRDNITVAYQHVSSVVILRANCTGGRKPIVPPTPLNDAMRLGVDEKGRPRTYNDKLKGIQFILHYCKVNRLAKNERGDAFFKEIPTEDAFGRFGTHAWRRCGDLTQLVYLAADKDRYPEAFRCIFGKGGNVEGIIKYLQNCRDAAFPVINKDRRLWAFQNGLFNGSNCQFMTWGDLRIHDGMVACKYIPEVFDYRKYVDQMKVKLANGKMGIDWQKIQDPEVDSIFSAQKLPAKVRLWTYVLMGRLAYPIKLVDLWQIQFFLKGVAGTGKSTLLQQLIYLWDPIDVAIISNTMERMFPLEALLNVFVYFGLDISDRFTLDQTLWQSMVSGEGLAVNQKFKSRISVEWDTPGAWAGNRTPPWKDNAGSVSRRLLVILFLITIGEASLRGDLGEAMRKNIGAFVMKIMSAYADIGHQFATTPIWQMLPDYFRETKRQLGQETNLLSAFLDADMITKGAGYKCPEHIFKEAFRWFCQTEKNQQVPNWEESYWGHPFSAQAIPMKIVKLTNEVYHGKIQKGEMKWVTGADIRSVVEMHAGQVAHHQAAAAQSESDGKANREAARRRVAAAAGVPLPGPGSATSTVTFPLSSSASSVSAAAGSALVGSSTSSAFRPRSLHPPQHPPLVEPV